MNDTDPAAERLQIDLLRKAGPARRATIASDLTNASRARARRGIAEAHPELSERDRQLLFAEVHYGCDLAERVRRYLRQRQRPA